MAIVDHEGSAWLAFGSFWSGLKLIPLELDGTRKGTELYALATRANTAIEAPYLVHRDGFYYLFESVDLCCRGANSTYKTAVGRAADITGPYLDRDGQPLLAGGGTILVTGGTRWRGPGHNAVLRTSSGDYNVYHSYDAQAGGAPTLRIALLTWSTDGWPTSAGP
jgi:arabinan endo-1,5-alpha-L-arabinosidase